MRLNPHSGALVRYATAVVSAVLAALLTILAWPLIKPLATPLFLAAILITAWRGGKGPGIVASLLSGVLIDYVFITPRYQLSGHWDDIGRLGIFAVEGFILSWLIDARRRVENEVRRSREELRALYTHLQSVVEQERARISREIHDELGRELTGIRFDISWSRDQAALSTNAPELERLNATLKNVDAAINSVRRIATELRPAVLDTLGLTAAIEWQARDFETRTGIECHLSPMTEDIPLDREDATAVFRIFQESLTNVARHANATKVRVWLERVDGHLLLRLADNGRGIADVETRGAHSLGILGMQERVRLLNGEMRIEGEAGHGTVVNVEIPSNGSECDVTGEGRAQ